MPPGLTPVSEVILSCGLLPGFVIGCWLGHLCLQVQITVFRTLPERFLELLYAALSGLLLGPNAWIFVLELLLEPTGPGTPVGVLVWALWSSTIGGGSVTPHCLAAIKGWPDSCRMNRSNTEEHFCMHAVALNVEMPAVIH